MGLFGQSESERQLEMNARQLAANEAQQYQAEKQLARTNQLQEQNIQLVQLGFQNHERFQKLLERWEGLTDRLDALLKKWESK